MKKITLKISLFLLLSMFVLQVQGQAFDGTPGIYKIRVNGSSPELFVTQDSGVNNAKYQVAATAGNENTQLFTIVAHPSGTNWSITSQMTGEGALQPNDTSGTSSTMGFGTEAIASGQQDRWEIRNGTRLFLDSDDTGTGWEGSTAKRRIQVNSGGIAADKSMFMAGGTQAVFDFILEQSLSTEAFDASSIFIANPIKNQLTVKGLTSNISQVAVYSLLGQEVMSRQLNGESSLSLDVSALTSGMYIVNFKGENGSLTKKIVKQ
ncbi:Por secretion system C-terminal sorting domain-containing protein [Hyunsoonleella jejuensis]|uniref:Por secretion system C-terminal sorting domain-containing protein n=1 Tax=Hyunsoonleella jejuensis TaxID=419940 RepID=A0A1H9IUW1_9FLAO|nr:T9SS type A sorting domain-containing protein [Hyunsoonleella jejuensis]SEQ78329.1 Por secretion system C-terminal sorting domain-containing protein [Hyunsoonleella jejuensis]